MSAEIRLLGEGTDALGDEQLTKLYAVPDRRMPWVRANFVSSLDGASTHNGLSGDLGTEADRRVFELLRRLADVILVGAGTVRAEGYHGLRLSDESVGWRTQHGLPPQPVFAVASARLDLDPAVFAGNPVRPLIVTCARAPEERRSALAEVADVIECGEASVDTRAMRDALAARGLPQIHSEGGPHLFGTMIAEDTIDELCLTLSARLEGGVARRIADGHAINATGMSLAHALAATDGTLLLRYKRTGDSSRSPQ